MRLVSLPRYCICEIGLFADDALFEMFVRRMERDLSHLAHFEETRSLYWKMVV